MKILTFQKQDQDTQCLTFKALFWSLFLLNSHIISSTETRL